MRKFRFAAVLVAGVLVMALAIPAGATGNEGCTPGYWKNHPSSWSGYNPSTNPSTGSDFFSVLGVTDQLPGSTIREDWPMMKALAGGGGDSIDGAIKILARAATAAFLNAAAPDDELWYPLHRDDSDHPETGIRYMVQQAWGDRDAMLELASYLDSLNNLGCTLN